MSKPVKHSVKINGRTIGVRKSPRTYTHAIIGFRNEARDVADAIAYDERYVRDQIKSAERELANPHQWPAFMGKEAIAKANAEFKADAEATIAAGYEVLLAKRRASGRSQEDFARKRAKLAEHGEVLQWSMSEKNANAKVGYWQGLGWIDVRVVEVERAAGE